MKELLGEEYESYIESFQEPWKPGLRANTLKLSGENLRALLPWELTPVPWTENGFYYELSKQDSQIRPSKHPFYYAGLYYLQEASAMTPAAMLPVEPGDRVLDLCAAPGGKSTELAAKLAGKGMLVSNDISYSRARALLKNLELTGAGNICVVSEEPEKLAKVWPGFFDKILVDAPCSGEGMFRRDEDMVKDWEEHGPAYYAPIQREILKQAVTMLKPGGLLLYSTCTFSKTEDEETVEALLGACPEMELVELDKEKVPGSVGGVGLSGCMRLFPHRLKGEGHFLALLRKTEGSGAGEETSRAAGAASGSSPSKAQKALFETLSPFLRLCSLTWEPERLFANGEQIYYLPEGLTPGLPLRFLRTGLLLGEVKKGRFEPSQALAMFLKKGEFGNTFDLSPADERVIRYLKGETISLLPKEEPLKDWCLVSCGGYSLGWAKGNGMNLKNKYYPGWRWQ
jgi:NOL1/NOP2/sun family putative RNA methylase